MIVFKSEKKSSPCFSRTKKKRTGFEPITLHCSEFPITLPLIIVCDIFVKYLSFPMMQKIASFNNFTQNLTCFRSSHRSTSWEKINILPKKEMIHVRHTKKDESLPKCHATTSIESKEQYLIGLAYDLVEERLRNGTATSQETTHFLKLGSTRERIEREMLENQKEVLKAKAEAIQSQKRIEELYAQALSAFKSYSGEE